MSEQFWWHLARASGIVAWLFLTASVLWGLLLSTDLFAARRRPAWLLDLHRALGGLTVGFLGIHVGSLVADSYVSFGPADILLPFAASWQPDAVAYGVVAMWGLLLVELTSLVKRRIPTRVWRGVHLTSYAVFVLTSLHGTYAGSDASNPLYVGTTVVTTAALMAVACYRIVNRRSVRRAAVG